jgi:hypothetical protein
MFLITTTIPPPVDGAGLHFPVFLYYYEAYTVAIAKLYLYKGK